MASTQNVLPELEKSIVGSDFPYAQLKALRQTGMIAEYQRLNDRDAVWTRFLPIDTVDYETWEQMVFQNDQLDQNVLEPHPHVVGTDFPLSSIEEPTIRQYAMGGYANRIHIPAGYWRFRKGPENAIARARRITLSKWN
jgi:hypothetical protein